MSIVRVTESIRDGKVVVNHLIKTMKSPNQTPSTVSLPSYLTSKDALGRVLKRAMEHYRQALVQRDNERALEELGNALDRLAELVDSAKCVRAQTILVTTPDNVITDKAFLRKEDVIVIEAMRPDRVRVFDGAPPIVIKATDEDRSELNPSAGAA